MTFEDQSTGELVAALGAPFPETEIEWRVQRFGVSNGNPWASLAVYHNPRYCRDRLDAVMGHDGWDEQYRFEGRLAICDIRIFPPSGRMIVRSFGAGMEQPSKSMSETDVGKSACTYAFRAAFGNGFCRYLWFLPPAWAEGVREGRPPKGDETALSHYDRDSKKSYYFYPPKLPDWALPGGSGRPPAGAQAGNAKTADAAEEYRNAALTDIYNAMKPALDEPETTIGKALISAFKGASPVKFGELKTLPNSQLAGIREALKDASKQG